MNRRYARFRRATFMALPLSLLFLLPTINGNVRAEGVHSYSIRTAGQFQKGTFEGTMVTAAGILGLAPNLKKIGELDEANVWRVAVSPGGERYFCATGDNGTVLEVKADGTVSTVFSADEPEVHAILCTPSGLLYVATSPDGRIYRLDPENSWEGTVFFDPEESYIWDLALDGDAGEDLVCATGHPRGRIYRISSEGQSELLFESDATHVKTIALSRSGSWLLGTSGPGWLVRMDPSGGVFALADPGAAEISDILETPQGVIYASALGKPPAPKKSGNNGGESKKSSPPSESATAADSSADTKPRFTGSRLMRLEPGGFPELIWGSTSETALSLALRGRSLLVGTSQSGKVFAPEEAGKSAAVIVDSDSAAVTDLYSLPDGRVLACLSQPGGLAVIEETPVSTGGYISEIVDSGTYSRWGVLEYLGSNQGILLSTRSGNTKEPDSAWSDWETVSTERKVRSPGSRYLQIRVDLKGSGNMPVVREVSLKYLPRNLPPIVQNLRLLSPGVRLFPQPVPEGLNSSRSSDPNNSGRTNSQFRRPVKERLSPGFRSARWDSKDPNGDLLLYRVDYRLESSSDWNLLQDEVEDPFISWDSRLIPDGLYLLRVTAFDARSNPPQFDRETDQESLPFIVDNTPPEIELLEAKVEPLSLRISFVARDAISPLLAVYRDVPGGIPVSLVPDDGILDEIEEEFEIVVNLEAGTREILLQVIDTSGNTHSTRVPVPE